MRNKKQKFTIVTFFSVLFVILGFFLIIYSIHYVTKVDNSKYRQETFGVVQSVKKESDWFDEEEIRELSEEAYRWRTKEEIYVKDGQNFIYDGIYYEEPKSGEIHHTIISKDGINWVVNDSKGEDILFNSMFGILCIVIGNCMIQLERKDYL